MLTIQIQDEQLARQLQAIAEREKRPVEDVLKSMVSQYPAETPSEVAESGESDPVRRVRRKAYTKARQYWQSVGDADKAALTDEALDEQFGAFDEEGIPRLKSELKSPEPPVGSLAYAAQIAEGSRLHSGKPDLARRSEDILDQHFADDFSKRMRGEDAAE
jgi:hypothetical protein